MPLASPSMLSTGSRILMGTVLFLFLVLAPAAFVGEWGGHLPRTLRVPTSGSFKGLSGGKEDVHAEENTALRVYNKMYPNGVSGGDDTSVDCIAGFQRKDTFADRKLLLGDLVPAGGQVYAVGDSVIGQLLYEKNGLACSHLNWCAGGSSSALNKMPSMLQHKANSNDWQHLSHMWARCKQYTACKANRTSVWWLAPRAPGDATANEREKAARLVGNFIRSHTAGGKNGTAKDLLLIGLLGNHFHEPHMRPAWEVVATTLMRDVVASFVGRVVVLGYSPQHFSMSGGYVPNSGVRSCGPTPLLYTSFRASIWAHAFWLHVDSHKKAPASNVAFLDTTTFLQPLWACHHDVKADKPVDCTHWSPAIYAILSEMVLFTLGHSFQNP